MGVIHLLTSNGFITVNKHLARTLGLDEAVIFGELCSKYDYREKRGELDENGFFYCTVEDLEENTALSDHKQRKAINNLVKIGLVEQVTKDLPRKRFFKINENAVLKIFDIQSLNFLRTVSENFKEIELKNFQINKNTHNKNTKQEYINKNIEKEGYRGKVNNIHSDKLSEEIKEQPQKSLPPPPKSPYGEFGNVFLSDDEHKKLIDRYGEQTTERFIKNLDLWLGEGHTKKSHYMTIIRWVENEKEKGVKSYAGNTGAYRARNETGYHGFTPSTGVKTEPDF